MSQVKQWISDISYTDFFLIATLAKYLLAPSWVDILVIAIALGIHYAKRMIPKTKTLVVMEEDLIKEIAAIRESQSVMRDAISNLKLRVGIKGVDPVK